MKFPPKTASSTPALSPNARCRGPKTNNAVHPPHIISKVYPTESAKMTLRGRQQSIKAQKQHKLLKQNIAESSNAPDELRLAHFTKC